MLQWRQIVEFPDYSVSEAGHIRNDTTGLVMQLTPNTRGIPIVGLVKRGVQYKRSVPVLVADAYIVTSRTPNYNTPIHLDGDKNNCRATNLAWRPRWFALEYGRQFLLGPLGFACEIQEIKSGEIFATSWDAAVKYGLLERDIVFSVMRHTYVVPTYQTFRLLA